MLAVIETIDSFSDSFIFYALTSIGTGMQKVSDKDIADVVKELSQIELKHVYEELGLSHIEVENAEDEEKSNALDLKAKRVLRHWRQMNGSQASRKKILHALEKCKYRNAMEELQEKWGVPYTKAEEKPKGLLSKFFNWYSPS